MDAQGLFARPLFGLVANQRHELFVFQNALDHADAVGPFGMARSIVMRQAGRMRNQQRIQCSPTNSSAAPASLADQSLSRPKSEASAAGASNNSKLEHRPNPRCPTAFKA